ncbi:hypothetical protein R1sor_000380 [Riccia sorocarpa]|uniref:Cytochrome P450 n=1 Tax=Riccia sorocarpa TaxID=122646 RepID=A0ABD3GTR9_9MARC
MWTEEFISAVQQIATALAVFCPVFLIWWNWQTAGRGFRSIPSKGSLGWPIIGETLSVGRCTGEFTFERWLRERLQKYGTMFKSHVFLRPTIVMTTPEEVKFVLLDPHKLMINGIPPSLKWILGNSSIFALEGKEHRDVYKILNDSVLMPELKNKTSEFNRLMRHSLSSWEGRTEDVAGAMQKIIFKGLTSLPIYFPGTAFYKASNARKEVDQIVLPIIRKLRSNASSGSSEYASSAERFPYQNLLDFELNGEKISDMAVCDILLSPILTGTGPSTVVALAIYHLTKNPSMLQRAQVR